MSMVRYLKLIELYKPEKNKTVIDCACGSGEGMKVIQDRLTPGRLLGVDIDRKALITAKEITNSKAEFAVKSLMSLPYFDQFDYFFCVETLEHIYGCDLTKAVTSIINALKTGGTLFITVPGNEKVCWMDKRHRQFLPPSKLIDLFIDHFDSFNGEVFVKNILRPQAYTTVMQFKGKK